MSKHDPISGLIDFCRDDFIVGLVLGMVSSVIQVMLTVIAGKILW